MTALDLATKTTARREVSRAKLIVLLARINRPTICTIYAETVPGMVKRDRETGEPNPYHGRLCKQARVNGVICFDYASAVNAQRVRESNAETLEELDAVEPFEPRSRMWGHRIRNRRSNGTRRVSDTCFVEHDGWLYLEIKVQNRIAIRYTLDRVPVTDKRTVAGIERYFYRRAGESKRQKLKKPVVLRDYGIETLLGIQLGGELLVVARDG